MKTKDDRRAWVNKTATGFVLSPNQQFYDVELGADESLNTALYEFQERSREVQAWLTEIYEMRRGGRHPSADALVENYPSWLKEIKEATSPTPSEAGSNTTSRAASKKKAKRTRTKKKASNSGSPSREGTGAESAAPEKS